LALDADGNLYFAESCGDKIKKISNTGILSTVAGNYYETYSGDGVAATASSLYIPNFIG
jgi:hypothetical protein